MITIRKSSERGHAEHGWLESFHTFSFSEYYDPRFVHFRQLRVINEDFVQAGEGFDTHPHNDMEIVTYVIQGALKHQDSMGNGSVIRPGDVQRMSAGTGVTHSEFNASGSEPVHLLQIWIFPEKKGIEPSYEQKNFSDEEKRGKLKLVASRDGREGSVLLHQDVNLYASILPEGRELTFENRRNAWVQVIRGNLTLQDGGSGAGQTLSAGDGASITAPTDAGVERIRLQSGTADTEFLVFDLA